MTRRRLSWLALVIVLGLALAVGTRAEAASSPQDRARSLAATIKCPTCRSQSAATSDAPAAKFIREEISRRIADGQSNDEIRDYFASRYGEEILLTPSASGVAGLVWIVPVVVVVLAAAGLGYAFLRWRRWST